jgi:ABC-type polysaccharide/polyol phosphate export permease
VLIKKISLYFPDNNRLERIWKLAQVDFRRRYYHDRLGILWALIRPIFEVLIYYVVFTTVFQVQQENYALFIFCGIIIWSGFSEATNRGMGLLSEKLYLIQNIQLNKIDLYLAYLSSVFMAMGFNLFAFLGISALFDVFPDTQFFWLPVVLLTFFILTLGFIMILSCLQPFFKDLIHLWDMILMLGIWVSGVFYPYKMIVEKIPILLYLNPFIGIIHNMRSALMGGSSIDFKLLAINFMTSLFIYLVAVLTVKKYGRLAIEKI